MGFIPNASPMVGDSGSYNSILIENPFWNLKIRCGMG